MIEILNVNPVRKGVLLATVSVKIAPWCLTLHQVKIFEKGQNRWLGMPSRDYALETGEKKYDELIVFDSPAVAKRFRDQIMVAFDKYLEINPEMTPDDVIKEGDDLPF